MSLGYQRGNMWVADDRYAAYAQTPQYQRLLKACTAAGFTFNATYSYTARQYTAEATTCEQTRSGWQIIRHNNAYDPNPMAALSKACRAYSNDALVLVCCLEIEVLLLKEAGKIYDRRMTKLSDALDFHEQTLAMLA